MQQSTHPSVISCPLAARSARQRLLTVVHSACGGDSRASPRLTPSHTSPLLSTHHLCLVNTSPCPRWTGTTILLLMAFCLIHAKKTRMQDTDQEGTTISQTRRQRHHLPNVTIQTLPRRRIIHHRLSTPLHHLPPTLSISLSRAPQ